MDTPKPSQPTAAASGPPPVIVTSTKSVGIALLLTFLFGPLGMFYSTVPGAIVMLVVSVIVGAVTFGFGLLVTWPISMVWSAMAAKSHNERLLVGTKKY